MRYLYYSLLLGAIVCIAACGSSTTGASAPQTATSSAGGVGAKSQQIVTIDGLNIDDGGMNCGSTPVLLKPAASFSANDVTTLMTYFNSLSSIGGNGSIPFPSTLLGEQAGSIDSCGDNNNLTITNTRQQPIEIDNVNLIYAEASTANTNDYRLYGCNEFTSHTCTPNGIGVGGTACGVSFTLIPGPKGTHLTSSCATTLQPGGVLGVVFDFTGNAQKYIVNFQLSLGDGSLVTLPASFASSHVLVFPDPHHITCNHRQGNHIVQLPYNPSIGCQFPHSNG